MTTQTEKKLGRPPKPAALTGEQVFELCKLAVPVTEIAKIAKLSVDTLDRRFRQDIERGRHEMRQRIRLKLFELLDAGVPSVATFLGRTVLGLSEKAPLGAEEVPQRIDVVFDDGHGGVFRPWFARDHQQAKQSGEDDEPSTESEASGQPNPVSGT